MNIANKSKIYKSNNHLFYSCQYHVIFCPKYRRKVLVNGIDTRLKEILIDTANKYSFEIIEMEVMPDHVHLLIDCSPTLGILECVKKLKGTSSRILKKEFPDLKKKLPCLWTRSSFISTVGEVSLETVKTYIQDQKKV